MPPAWGGWVGMGWGGGGGGGDIGDIVLYCIVLYCIELYCILKAFLEASGAADFCFVEKIRSWSFEHAKVSKRVKMNENS